MKSDSRGQFNFVWILNASHGWGLRVEGCGSHFIKNRSTFGATLSCENLEGVI